MTLRAIEFRAVDDPAPRAPLPVLREVPIDLIVMDDSYQRPLGPKNWIAIAKIARGFDWAFFGAVTVAPLRDGRFALIDGQHRVHAAAAVGHTAVPAVIQDLDVARQAAAFARINGAVTAMTPYHLFRAALAAREDWALASAEAVSRAGCRLMTCTTSFRSRRPCDVYAIALVRGHVTAGRAQAVTRALAALAEVEGGAPDCWADAYLSPWIAAVSEVASASPAALAGFLRAHPLRKVRARVDELLAQPRYSGQTRRALMLLSIRTLLAARLARSAA